MASLISKLLNQMKLTFSFVTRSRWEVLSENGPTLSVSEIVPAKSARDLLAKAHSNCDTRWRWIGALNRRHFMSLIDKLRMLFGSSLLTECAWTVTKLFPANWIDWPDWIHSLDPDKFRIDWNQFGHNVQFPCLISILFSRLIQTS